MSKASLDRLTDEPAYALAQVQGEVAEQVQGYTEMMEAQDRVVKLKEGRKVTDVSVRSRRKEGL